MVIDHNQNIKNLSGNKFKLLSLFAGLGGFELGLERSGFFETVAQCEIDSFCNKVLAKHWPDVKRYHDVRELTGERLRADGISVDAICGGFPCQDISVAGRGAGLSGERSGLWFEYARIISEIRPRYVIVENVAALLGRGMGTVLADLATIGYDAEWHCVPATYVGAWHRRDRVWILAYPNKISRQQRKPEGAILRQRNVHEQSEGSFARWPGRSSLPKSRICGRNDGIPQVPHRLAALGNAVVPQIPELIGRAIGEYEFNPASRLE